jgi:predicted ribosome quality control (RQC) complex YloA/Tae2 family protein
MTPPSLNWREIDLVLSELSLPGSLIQDVHQPAHDRVVLDLFRAGNRFSVLVALSSRFPRMHILTEKLSSPKKPLRFASFLRAHIRGGRIESAEQVASERVLRIEVEKSGERRILWVRLWGSAANIVVTDTDGAILDAFYRRPKKGEISGGRFSPPVPERKKEYSVRELPGPGSFNEKIELVFRDIETHGDIERLAAQAEAELEISENKILSSIETLRARLAEYANIERYKELGDLVASAIHTLVKGDRWLKVEDFFHENAQVEIELSPELAPAQNAEKYYEKHKKARLGRSRVEEEIARLEATLKKVRAQRVALAENLDPASLVRAAKKAAQARAPLQVADQPGLLFSSSSFRILVGRTASENDDLLRKRVRGNDWWFHARDWPGAYVFVKAQSGKSLPLETMLDAANLAIHFSRGKSSGQGDVYYTQVKYLRRAKGAKKGTVLPTQEKNLHIKLEPGRIERLKQGVAGDEQGA